MTTIAPRRSLALAGLALGCLLGASTLACDGPGACLPKADLDDDSGSLGDDASPMVEETECGERVGQRSRPWPAPSCGEQLCAPLSQTQSPDGSQTISSADDINCVLDALANAESGYVSWSVDNQWAENASDTEKVSVHIVTIDGERVAYVDREASSWFDIQTSYGWERKWGVAPRPAAEIEACAAEAQSSFGLWLCLNVERWGNGCASKSAACECL